MCVGKCIEPYLPGLDAVGLQKNMYPQQRSQTLTLDVTVHECTPQLVMRLFPCTGEEKFLINFENLFSNCESERVE
jgi:hypothetical protein